MSPKIFTFALAMLLCMPAAVRAGNIDELMNLRIFSTEEINLNLSEHIARLYEESNADSVEIVLDEWERRVGHNGMVQRFSALWHIERGEFWSEDIDEEFFDGLLSYRDWAEAWADADIVGMGNLAVSQYGYPARFENVMTELALYLSLNEERDSDAQLVALAYQNQFPVLFRRLKSPATIGTALRREYDARIRAVYDASDDYVTLHTGFWRAGGGLGVMGDHPTFGGSMRRAYQKYYVALSASFQPVDAPREFEFRRGNEVIRTDRFVGLDIFVDGGRHLYRSRRTTLTGTVGVGLASFSGFYGDADPPESEDFWTPAVSIGATYRWRISEFTTNSLILGVRYTIANYENGSGSEFHGNNISFEIGWGFNRWNKYAQLGRLN